MRILDISRELLGAPVYPGDTAPQLHRRQQMKLGDRCNLSDLHLCLHNGTHMDAPRHFLPDGDGIDAIPPDVFCGACSVVACDDGVLLGDAAERLLAGGVEPRLLLKGAVTLDVSAAFVFADAGLRLIGVEGPSVATSYCEEAVHRQLLGAGVTVLEGLDLSAATVGRYTLCAAPLKIAEADGAPVRALLFDGESLDVEPLFRKR